MDPLAKKMADHAQRYSDLYNECHTQIASYQRSAIQSQILGGIGSAAKSLGQAIAAIPVLGKGQVDEALISASENIGKFNTEAVAKKLEVFEPLADSRMGSFIDNIHTVNLMYNQNAGLITDGENLYVLQAA